MKRLFCDGCIEAMLKAVESQAIGELLILDTEKDTFYPIEDERAIQIGDYKLKTEYKDSGYEKTIKSTDAE